MPIDWFTVGAQALNFIILVWLLKRLLYRPILDAIDAREQHVARELAAAESKRIEAQSQRDEFARKNADFERQRAALLRQATDEATAERQRLFEAVRHAADALSAKRQEALQTEAANLQQDLGRRVGEEVLAISRRALRDLAASNLEERIVEVFIRRLHELDAGARLRLAESARADSDPPLLRSAFALPERERTALQAAWNDAIAADVPLHFVTAPEVVGGIELTAGGQKLAWSIAEYLASLDTRFEELLSRGRGSHDATAAAKS